MKGRRILTYKNVFSSFEEVLMNLIEVDDDAIENWLVFFFNFCRLFKNFRGSRTLSLFKNSFVVQELICGETAKR